VITCKNILKLCLLNLLIFFTATSYAYPFIIVPKAGTTLPTLIGNEGSVTAYYTVTNNTLTTRKNNTVEYLPPNVTQVKTGGTFPTTCGEKFTLAPFGHGGDSCTLQLKIDGAVDASDPDQTHHLFVCFTGMQVCAGTNQSLNVVAYSLTVSPTIASLISQSTLQYTATLEGSDHSAQNVTDSVRWSSSNLTAATISNTGLATAVRGAMTTHIQAVYNDLVLSNAAVLNTIKKISSIVVAPASPVVRVGFSTRLTATAHYNDTTTGDITGTATWTSASPPIATVNAGLVTGAFPGSVSITASEQDITSPADIVTVVRFAYVGSLITTTPSLQVCLVNLNDGTLSSCTSNTTTPSMVQGVAVNAAGTFLYGYSNAGNQLGFCAINVSGSLGACAITTAQPGPLAANKGIALNPAVNVAYIPGTGSILVSSCTINSTTGNIMACSSPLPTSGSFNYPAVNPTASVLYGASADSMGAIWYCPLNTDGSISNCIFDQVLPSSIPILSGVAIDKSGAHIFFLYQTGASTCQIKSCNISASSPVPVCPTLPPLDILNCTGPTNLAIDVSGTHLYASDSTGTLNICAVNSGVISACQASTTSPTVTTFIGQLDMR
jgi:hypothetical protein